MKVRVKALGLNKKDPKVIAFIIYNLNGENHRRFEEVGEHRCDSKVCFTSYSNTFRPCGTGATTMLYKQ
ncbi:hypothetical protein Lal_00005018 [Lupinus albus]|nr:hypothetical protein Lal_00005018 [Lupinus albus]